jgi:hypothetical protein
MPRLVIDSGSLPIRQAFELCNFHKAALGKSDGQLLKPGDNTSLRGLFAGNRVNALFAIFRQQSRESVAFGTQLSH